MKVCCVVWCLVVLSMVPWTEAFYPFRMPTMPSMPKINFGRFKPFFNAIFGRPSFFDNRPSGHLKLHRPPPPPLSHPVDPPFYPPTLASIHSPIGVNNFDGFEENFISTPYHLRIQGTPKRPPSSSMQAPLRPLFVPSEQYGFGALKEDSILHPDTPPGGHGSTSNLASTHHQTEEEHSSFQPLEPILKPHVFQSISKPQIQFPLPPSHFPPHHHHLQHHQHPPRPQHLQEQQQQNQQQNHQPTSQHLPPPPPPPLRPPFIRKLKQILLPHQQKHLHSPPSEHSHEQSHQQIPHPPSHQQLHQHTPPPQQIQPSPQLQQLQQHSLPPQRLPPSHEHSSHPQQFHQHPPPPPHLSQLPADPPHFEQPQQQSHHNFNPQKPIFKKKKFVPSRRPLHSNEPFVIKLEPIKTITNIPLHSFSPPRTAEATTTAADDRPQKPVRLRPITSFQNSHFPFTRAPQRQNTRPQFNTNHNENSNNNINNFNDNNINSNVNNHNSNNANNNNNKFNKNNINNNNNNNNNNNINSINSNTHTNNNNNINAVSPPRDISNHVSPQEHPQFNSQNFATINHFRPHQNVHSIPDSLRAPPRTPKTPGSPSFQLTHNNNNVHQNQNNHPINNNNNNGNQNNNNKVVNPQSEPHAVFINNNFKPQRLKVSPPKASAGAVRRPPSKDITDKVVSQVPNVNAGVLPLANEVPHDPFVRFPPYV